MSFTVTTQIPEKCYFHSRALPGIAEHQLHGMSLLICLIYAMTAGNGIRCLLLQRRPMSHQTEGRAGG